MATKQKEKDFTKSFSELTKEINLLKQKNRSYDDELKLKELEPKRREFVHNQLEKKIKELARDGVSFGWDYDSKQYICSRVEDALITKLMIPSEALFDETKKDRGLFAKISFNPESTIIRPEQYGSENRNHFNYTFSDYFESVINSMVKLNHKKDVLQKKGYNLKFYTKADLISDKKIELFGIFCPIPLENKEDEHTVLYCMKNPEKFHRVLYDVFVTDYFN